MSKVLFSQGMAVQERALDLYLKRHSLLAANVANVATPRYTPVDLEFNGELADMLKLDNGGLSSTRDQHFRSNQTYTGLAEGKVIYDPVVSPTNDLNTVDMDQEMEKLGKNTLMYETIAKILSKNLSMLRAAIDEK